MPFDRDETDAIISPPLQDFDVAVGGPSRVMVALSYARTEEEQHRALAGAPLPQFQFRSSPRLARSLAAALLDAADRAEQTARPLN